MTVKVFEGSLFWKIRIPILNWKDSGSQDRRDLERQLISEALESQLEMVLRTHIRISGIRRLDTRCWAELYIPKNGRSMHCAGRYLQDFDFSTSFVKAFLDLYNPRDVHVVRSIRLGEGPSCSLVILKQNSKLEQVYGPVEYIDRRIDLIELCMRKEKKSRNDR